MWRFSALMKRLQFFAPEKSELFFGVCVFR
jgi:hypothetical protein